jgi:predicted nucleic acid-binding protein
MDTVFIEALLNRRNQYHEQAVSLWPFVRGAGEVWLTEAILTEVGNGMSALDRTIAVQFLRQCYRAANLRVVPIDTPLFHRGLERYAARPDKQWGLTDCISFVVMQEQSLTEALMADHHFAQAGFQTLMERA